MIIQSLEEIVDTVFDVCIVGGGGAGITVARSLMGSGLTVLLVEAGAAKPVKEDEDLYCGEVVNPLLHPPAHLYRVRALGGATRIWGGRSVPFDPIDFAQRPWVKYSGWPISYEELLPYYILAQGTIEAGSFEYGTNEEIISGLSRDSIETTLERYSKPTDVWLRYESDLRSSKNIHLLLRANLTGIRLAPDGSRVDRLQVASASGKLLDVRAGRYVLAMGGLEVTRFLLASNDIRASGIGNDSDWVGRGYMCHLVSTVGAIQFFGNPRSVKFQYERDEHGIYTRKRLWIPPSIQERLQILNIVFRLDTGSPIDPVHNDPVLSLIFLARRLIKAEYSRKMREANLTWGQHLHHVRNVALQPLQLTRFMAKWISKHYLSERKLPSPLLYSPVGRYSVEFQSEQAPDRHSRITLSDGVDRYGIPRLRIDWRSSQLDIDTVMKGYAYLSEALERSGVGARLEYQPALLEEQITSAGAYGGHHVGTTRMSGKPEDGVVDPNCRIHGVSNLYICSSSVMPTSGHANPTLTLIALAWRLGEYLRTSRER